MGHVHVGAFTPEEFKAISKRLQEMAVPFEIECDTSAPGISVDGATWDRATVALFVRDEHVRAAAKIITDQRLIDGHVEQGAPDQ